MKNTGQRKREASFETLQLFDVPPSTLTAALERPMPHPSHGISELFECSRIGWHRVVAIMPVQHDVEPRMLLRHSVVASSLDFFLETSELRSSLLSRGLALELELASPVSAGDVHEPEKLERLGLS
jgi:hypothetical protein